MTAAATALAGELAFHRRLARPGLFVDVGAHVGAFSFAMAELPGVEVLAFEPLPHAYATLAERAAAKPACVPCRWACRTARASPR